MTEDFYLIKKVINLEVKFNYNKILTSNKLLIIIENIYFYSCHD